MRSFFAAFFAMSIVLGAALFAESQQPPSAWHPLFDGTSLDAWRGFKTDSVPSGWRIVDRTLAKETPVGDIVSKEEFGDFELELEWKIGEAGNSGIFYRGTEEYNRIYWSAPEYQLLDDIKGEDNKTRLTCAGAAYALYPSPEGHLKPVGQWNQVARVRTLESRLGSQSEIEQVQRLSEFRTCKERAHRLARRSRRHAGF